MPESPEQSLVPTRKVGTPFQSPSWRAEALFHPQRFGLAVLNTEANKQRKRTTGFSIEPLPADLEYVVNNLSAKLKTLYLNTLDRALVFDKKIRHTWNIKNTLKYANDTHFKEVILHVEGIKSNSDIAFAINLGTDKRQGVVAKMLSYAIFLGKSDVTLYKEWDIHPNKIKWYRLLFADFSHFPKDDIAKWTLLRQLTNNETISEVDFAYFKRISELGDVALKAQCAFHTLTVEERGKLENFLGNTAIVNVLDQHVAIKTLDDSRQYTRSVMEFAKLSAQKQHMRNVELSIRMNSAKLEQLSAQDSSTISAEEQVLIDEVYKKSLVNADFLPIKTIADLK